MHVIKAGDEKSPVAIDVPVTAPGYQSGGADARDFVTDDEHRPVARDRAVANVYDVDVIEPQPASGCCQCNPAATGGDAQRQCRRGEPDDPCVLPHRVLRAAARSTGRLGIGLAVATEIKRPRKSAGDNNWVWLELSVKCREPGQKPAGIVALDGGLEGAAHAQSLEIADGACHVVMRVVGTEQ